MKTEIIFISSCLLLTFASAYTYVPTEELEKGNGRILILIDRDNRPLFLNTETTEVTYVDVDETEVTFHYSSRTNPETELITLTIDDIQETDFDPQRKTMFIVHGWQNNKTSDLNPAITSALHQAADWNVFVVDWRDKASAPYNVALGAVPGVGEVVAKFIQLLMEKTGIVFDNINLAGHSLGSHVCGRAGNLLGGQIATIMAMDPALPLVDINDIDARIDTTDAQYVQVIHTNGGVLGFLEPLGHTDFFPNGGMNQKGCGLDPVGACAHSRSHMYFAESIINNNFRAQQCETYAKWKRGKCDKNAESFMGGLELNRLFGTFYLNTNQEQPFALG